jgi:hypothetical protein
MTITPTGLNRRLVGQGRVKASRAACAGPRTWQPVR